ncbi:WSC domain-containing protein [Aspergillus clavatus NRRL 1]|uniref:ER membrane protein (Wsc4), putative n=1 Tax=Aspergillus clavatus (strain ATCC 1007 / CBS 513.65 / DSM 816 / NCTC 3887 / NRRL 1 / QM 1276 / 107) TaxID=344612 RepID=A1CAF7_ASPCL|nr:ER membrane protein (Wsc4), putative [Aspergillus clavatus NRRL 1]EAW12725.1 ER membrane protein (Wsc4), putative [Aspergillus clavatus NRRL 1]
MSPDSTLLILALLASPVSAASALTYCSSVNTGASFSSQLSIYQSNGLCTTTCNSDYAFAILQGKECWCSNIAPNKATNTDVSDCDVGCPGYPDDSCGDASKGVFAYIQMSLHKPSGTATAPSSSKTTMSSTDTSKTDSTKTSTTEESTTTRNTVSVETIAGQVKTVTVSDHKTVPTATPTPTSEPDKGSSGVSAGTIAGAVIGAVGGLAAVVAIIFLVLAARRRSRAQSPDPSVNNNLLDGRQSKGSQMSFVKGMLSDGHSHTLSAGSSTTPQRLPTFTDNRMKTDTVLYGGQRRDSDLSLQDNEDYSRPVLRLTNPD